MTACLENLIVKKVSFVRRGANRKPFFLAKSADYVEKDINNNDHQEAQTMRPTIKTKLGEILKTERDQAKVCALLKADTELKVTDDEITLVKDFMSLLPPVVTPPPESDPTLARLKKAEEDNTTLRADLAKMQEATQRADILKWVEEECPYLNVAATEAVDKIMKMMKADKDMAEELKKSYKTTSDALRDSALFKRFGSSGDADYSDHDPVSDGYVATVVKKTQEVHKTNTARKASDAVIDAIKSIGGRRYAQYRSDHIYRAKTARTA
jgi:hypothetical protein